ncbi:hypothetical protein [Maricaulis parjimensis]|uniref:hypothetical protein n=1 Tax=Maricaulis parjimensis TaxID=144023 RepID=UPI001939402C|nr:hypothetical protein [Maricaulis parjimensis]
MTRRDWTRWLEPAGPPAADTKLAPTRQWLWFAGLALAGGLVVAATAYVLRGLLLLAQ